MQSPDYRDILGGTMLILIGASAMLYAVTMLNLGTMVRMGPGMFPAVLGFILTGFGVAIFVSGLIRRGAVPLDVRLWSPLFVLVGVAAFALLIGPFGLIPAIVAVTTISSFAELKVRPVSLAVLCVVLSLIAWLVFQVGLGMTLAMFRWPF